MANGKLFYFAAPLISLYVCICVVAFALQSFGIGVLVPLQSSGYFGGGLMNNVSFVTHIFGHANFEHLFGNMPFLLLYGLLIHDRYKTSTLLVLMVITAVSTGVIAVFMSTSLTGASGIVFLFLTLGVFSKTDSKGIPVEGTILALIFLGKEVMNMLSPDQVSQMAHVVGALVGIGYILIFRRNDKQV